MLLTVIWYCMVLLSKLSGRSSVLRKHLLISVRSTVVDSLRKMGNEIVTSTAHCIVGFPLLVFSSVTGCTIIRIFVPSPVSKITTWSINEPYNSGMCILFSGSKRQFLDKFWYQLLASKQTKPNNKTQKPKACAVFGPPTQ